MGIDSQRPTDPMTAQDAALIANQLEKFREVVLEVSNRMAVIQRDQNEIKGTLTLFTNDLAASRMARLELEISEGERERSILEQRIQGVDGRLVAKKNESVGAVDTNERIRRAAEAAYAEREKLIGDKRAGWWRETFQQAGRTILITLSVSGVLSVIAFLVWMVIFYLTNR